MEIFNTLYVNACSEFKVTPDKRVLEITNLCQSDLRSTLNFSECLLNLEICQCLGLALSRDVHVTHLDFKNCLLQEECLVELLKGLVPNKCVLSLNLMGNNIRSTGTLALAKLLSNNTHLQELVLDWNALGIVPEKFFVFCESLAANNTLKMLNLDHNQLNHQAAAALANSLLKNTCVEVLSVQFNSFGLIGGEAFLKAVMRNHTLAQVNIQGNNVGIAVEHSVEMAVTNNRERKALRIKHVEEARQLCNRLHDVESEKTKQVKELLETLEKNEIQTSCSQKMNSDRIFELETKLAIKEDELKSLSTKHKELVTNFSSAEEKLKTLENLYQEVESQSLERQQQHLNVLKTERKANCESEAKLQSEIAFQQEKMSELLKQMEDMKCEKSLLECSVQKLTAVSSRLESQLKETEQESSEQVRVLKVRHERMLNDAEDLRHKDISRLNKECAQTEQNCQYRVQVLEKQKQELELEITEQKTKVDKSKMEKEEMMEQHQKEMKSENVRLNQLMEEQTAFFEEAKAKQQQLLKEQTHKIDVLQSKHTKLILELEDKNHKLVYLQQQLSESEDIRQVEVAKVKLEVKEQLQDLIAQKAQNHKLTERIEQLNQSIEDLKKNHQRELQLLEDKSNAWRHELEQLKRKIQSKHEDEVKRASQLRLALSSYFNDVQQAASEPS